MELDEAFEFMHQKAHEAMKEFDKLAKNNQRDKAFTYLMQAENWVQVADWLTELADRREADRWIPVSEKLPPVNSEVIVTDRNVLTSYQATYVGNDYWECDNGTFNDRIVAWKWFPETYKEREDK